MLAAQLCATADATSRTEWRVPQPGIVEQQNSADDPMIESLRADVDRHPADFVTFTTRAEASHFLEQHAADARYETQRQMRELGILGYWQGRTIVVLPLVTRRTRSLWDPANLQ
ncbi:MAG TPA: hypothetical protein VFS41_09940 [Edaphobacter sp.]|nr:hypothetical protein [Edaphobacter sp.]